MVMTDPIADMLTRIRNANQMYKETVEIPASTVKRAILDVLKAEGFIRDYEYIADEKQGMLNVSLAYASGKERVLKGLKRISKPGLRVYANHEEIPKVLNGLGVAVLSTSQGVMTGHQAQRQKIGGEVIAYIW
jgi:small subunit ribosomal protein S8